MEVEIRNCTKKTADIAIIKKAIAETMRLLRIKSAGAVSVALVGEKKIRSLNKAWRGKDAVTDVLSFNFSEARGGWLKSEEIGEIIICLPYAKKQARQLGVSEKRNIALLAAHGMIHIFGIDHERSEKEACRTEEVQEKVLRGPGK